MVYTFTDDSWSTDSLNLSDYGFSNNRGFRYVMIIIDSLSNHSFRIPTKKIYGQTINHAFSTFSIISKRKSYKI